MQAFLQPFLKRHYLSRPEAGHLKGPEEPQGSAVFKSTCWQRASVKLDDTYCPLTRCCMVQEWSTWLVSAMLTAVEEVQSMIYVSLCK